MKKFFLPVLLLALLLACGCGDSLTKPPEDEPEQPADSPSTPEPPSGGEENDTEQPRDPVEIEGLVLVSDLDDTIVIDLKYATTDNFTGQVIYPVAVAAIKKETGERLVQANRIFQADGYTIKLWDAYRPYSAQRRLWEVFPDPRYVIKPEDQLPTSGFKARHNNGMAVDITLVDRYGNELEMPTAFDEFSEKAAPGYPHVSEEARSNAAYLISVMESAGFKVASTEWWHFNDVTGTPTPYLDIPLEAFLEGR